MEETILIDAELKQALERLKVGDDTYSDIIVRLLNICSRLAEEFNLALI